MIETLYFHSTFYLFLNFNSNLFLTCTKYVYFILLVFITLSFGYRQTQPHALINYIYDSAINNDIVARCNLLCFGVNLSYNNNKLYPCPVGQARQTRPNSGGGGCRGQANIQQRGGLQYFFYSLRVKNIPF